MTDYAKVVGNEVVAYGLPTLGELDGRKVSNFDKLPQAQLKKAGWLPIQYTEPPEHDEETHTASPEGWRITEDAVVQKWAISELVIDEPVEPTQPHISLEERIAQLEAEIEQLKGQNSAVGISAEQTESHPHDHQH